ncbi:MAG: hypothetical protein AMXMBFR56_23870 [Polyangiaceae bacterium]
MTGIKLGGLLALAFLLLGCGNDDDKKTSKSDSGTPSGWQAAVGADGAFAQTFDGVTWSTRTLVPHDLFAVTCVGNLDGWAAGESGFVGRTRDGGETWQKQDSGTSDALRTVHFAHDHHAATTTYTGVTAGDNGYLAVSNDGGDSWKAVDTGTSVTLRGASAALNADLIVVVGDAGTVLSTTDLGKTWHSQTLPGAGDLRAVDMAPNGSLVVSVDSKGQIWASKDLGKTFALEATAKGPLNGVAIAADASKGLAAGDGGIALRLDAAGNWTETLTGSTERLNAAMITHDGVREYLAGEAGTLLGAAGLGSWEKPALGTSATLYGLEDLDPH